MASEAERILRTLDKHLTGPGAVRLLGGAALVLGYGLNRSTEDADLLEDDAECRALMDHSGFSEAVEATNAELAAEGLYLTHIWGPEQQPLTPEWRENCRPVALDGARFLSLSTLGPIDLLLTKLSRGDAPDLEDVAWLIRREALDPQRIREALDRAVVPDVLRGTFAVSRGKLESMLGAARPVS